MLFAFGTLRAILRVEAKRRNSAKGSRVYWAFRPGVPGGANSCANPRLFLFHELFTAFIL
jgi:hypothetical protein